MKAVRGDELTSQGAEYLQREQLRRYLELRPLAFRAAAAARHISVILSHPVMGFC